MDSPAVLPLTHVYLPILGRPGWTADPPGNHGVDGAKGSGDAERWPLLLVCSLPPASSPPRARPTRRPASLLLRDSGAQTAPSLFASPFKPSLPLFLRGFRPGQALSFWGFCPLRVPNARLPPAFPSMPSCSSEFTFHLSPPEPVALCPVSDRVGLDDFLSFLSKVHEKPAQTHGSERGSASGWCWEGGRVLTASAPPPVRRSGNGLSI